MIIIVENNYMLVICYKFGKLEKKKQNKLGNRHQQTCVSMAYDQARLHTDTEKSVDQPARSSRESNCELVGSVWPARA